MKFLSLFILIGLLLPVFDSPDQANRRYTAMLGEHVRNGLVDYGNLCNDERLSQYISWLVETNPENLKSRDAKLAFWINAYNAYALKIVCDNYPLDSINDLHLGGLKIGSLIDQTIWDRDFVVIDHKQLSLNEIEHEIIRKQFDEPRIHFALVCAALSCPPLLGEAYSGEKLDAQLDSQAKKFLYDPQKNRFDAQNKVAYLSKIFDWFARDFGNSDQEILRYISQFLPNELTEKIGAYSAAWKISYKEYDWGLNTADPMNTGS